MDEPLAASTTTCFEDPALHRASARRLHPIPILYVSHSVRGKVARLAATVVRMDKGAGRGDRRARRRSSGATGLASATHRFEAVSVVTGTVAGIDEGLWGDDVAHPAGSIVVPGRLPHALARASVR